MSRKLSLATIAVAAALMIPTIVVSAQESETCQECPNCHAIEFELAGVDLPLTGIEQEETSKQEATSKKNGIAIQVECDCDIPFLNKLPLINHVFGTYSTEECEILMIDADSDSCCGTCCDTCKDGCNDCEQCNCTCCGDEQKEVKIEVAYSGVPFLSSIPYINPMFKHVVVKSAQCGDCQDCKCPAACAKTECPAALCGDSACETPACRADALLQLASHNEVSKEATKSSTEELKHKLMGLHVENARLEAKVQAMEHHMELMEEIYRVRAENEALKAQLKLMEMRNAETASYKLLHQPVELQRVVEQVRTIQKEQKQNCECSKNESGCTKANSK